MTIVPIEQYPMPRQWPMRAQSVPNIPRGSVGMVGSLRIIFEYVANGTSANAPVAIPGSSSNVTLGVCCQRLRPTGLVRDKRGSWELSPEAGVWTLSGDDAFLAATLCSNIKFMGEILYLLQEPKTISELQAAANDAYHLPWKRTSEVSRRLVWFRDLGLVEFLDYTLSYVLTDFGKSFLEHIDVTSPEEVAKSLEDENRPNYTASPWAMELCRLSQDMLAARKPSIGYCPGGKAELVATISAYVSYLVDDKTKGDIEQFSAENYGIKASSADSMLNMLSGIRFVERISRDSYRATDLAKRWNRDASPLDLCCCLHASCSFVFELLRELESGPKTRAELSAAAVAKYDVGGDGGSEVLKRTHFLQLAGLLKDYRAAEFSITPAGLEMLRKVSIQNADSAVVRDSADIAKGSAVAANVKSWEDGELLTELRLSARDSSNPDRFEKACADAFNALGFKAEWLGGSGKTDVLVSAQSAAKYAYRVAVDAKSSANGIISESQLNFDTLVDHRKLHNAQFTVVVGPLFQGERIVARAKKHGIVLMDVDALCELIKLHDRVPLSAQDYKALFESYGNADLDMLISARGDLTRSAVLLRAVMSCLVSQSDDGVTDGMLSAREIYVLLKAEYPDLLLSLDEIDSMLAFLSSPVVNCVGRAKSEYYAIGSLNEASNKLRFYANVCSMVDKGNML